MQLTFTPKRLIFYNLRNTIIPRLIYVRDTTPIKDPTFQELVSDFTIHCTYYSEIDTITVERSLENSKRYIIGSFQAEKDSPLSLCLNLFFTRDISFPFYVTLQNHRISAHRA